MPRWEIQTYPAPVLRVRGMHQKIIVNAMSVQHALEVAEAQIEEGYLVYSVNKIWD